MDYLFLWRQRAFRFEQSREQYLEVFLDFARRPPSPLLHLCHAQSSASFFPLASPSPWGGRTDEQPLNQHLCICAGMRNGGRCLGHIHIF